jgi:hypothetical protein
MVLFFKRGNGAEMALIKNGNLSIYRQVRLRT